jgi:hypothetical protein
VSRTQRPSRVLVIGLAGGVPTSAPRDHGVHLCSRPSARPGAALRSSLLLSGQTLRPTPDRRGPSSRGSSASSGLGGCQARGGPSGRALQLRAAVGGRPRALRTADRVIGEPAAGAAGVVAKRADVPLAHARSGRKSWIGTAASMAIGRAGPGCVGANRPKPSVASAESTATRCWPHSGQVVSVAVAARLKRRRQPGQERWVIEDPFVGKPEPPVYAAARLGRAETAASAITALLAASSRVGASARHASLRAGSAGVIRRTRRGAHRGCRLRRSGHVR